MLGRRSVSDCVGSIFQNQIFHHGNLGPEQIHIGMSNGQQRQSDLLAIVDDLDHELSTSMSEVRSI